MKFQIIAISAFAALSLTHPLIERGVFTSWVYEVETVTVTASNQWQGSWSQQSTSEVTAQPTPAMQPTTTEAIPSTTNAPQPTMVNSQPTQASVTSPATTIKAATNNNAGSYGQPILDQHNIHRDNQSVSPLTWDNNLANIAQQIAQSCVYAHNVNVGGGGYGQNIGAGAPGSDVPSMITNQMYNDEMMYYPGYGFEPSMDNFEKWGHFSQIVWKDTTAVGCYTAYCPNGLANTGANVAPYFTVCNYKPAGNFIGEFAQNVLPPLGHPAVTVKAS